MNTKRLQQFEKVRYVGENNKVPGIKYGVIGFILEVYDDGNYEVEFSDESGITIAWQAFSGEDIEPA